MKEKDITKEVIKLSKEIADSWRVEIEKFGWFSLNCDPSPFNLDNYTFWKEGECIYQSTHDLLDPNQVTIYTKREWFPIPSISDCLEKLRELGWRNYQFSFAEDGKIEMHILHIPFTFRAEEEIIVQGTPLEALLSALLKVLRG